VGQDLDKAERSEMQRLRVTRWSGAHVQAKGRTRLKTYLHVERDFQIRTLDFARIATSLPTAT
jgi:hypothetical protein